MSSDYVVLRKKYKEYIGAKIKLGFKYDESCSDKIFDIVDSYIENKEESNENLINELAIAEHIAEIAHLVTKLN